MKRTIFLLFILFSILFSNNIFSQNNSEFILEIEKNKIINIGENFFQYQKFVFRTKSFDKFAYGKKLDEENLITNIYSKEDIISGINLSKNFYIKALKIYQNTVRVLIKTNTPKFLSNLTFTKKTPTYLFPKVNEDLSLNFNVTNKGLLTEIFEVKLKENYCYKYNFKSKGYDIKKIEIEKGETIDITLSIKFLDICEEKNMVLNPKLVGKYQNHSKFFHIDLNKEFTSSFKYTLQKTYQSGKPGETIKNKLRFKNDGTNTVNNIDLKIVSPNKNWIIKFSKNQIKELKKKSYLDVELEYIIPKTAKPNDIFLKIQATTKNTKLPEQNIRVNIKNDSSSSYFGLLTIVIFLTLVVFIFKKLGRR